jgi:hypothetical protein
MPSFKILSVYFFPGPRYSYQKWLQSCSTVKFAEQNSRFNLSQSEFVWDVTFQNSECLFLFLDPNIVTKNGPQRSYQNSTVKFS